MVEPRNMFRKGSVASLMEINAPWPFGGPAKALHSAPLRERQADGRALAAAEIPEVEG